MNIADFLSPERIVVPLAAKEKKSAIEELVTTLAKSMKIKNPELVLASVLEREATRTTGVGHGLAIPHSKCPGVKNLSIAIGKPAEPIDFQSIDGLPVFLIVLLVSPPEQTGAHIQALAKVSRLMTIDAFRGKLKSANSAQEVYDAICKQEKMLDTASV
jgi:PTS system nitrogen regulatory IIA component